MVIGTRRPCEWCTTSVCYTNFNPIPSRRRPIRSITSCAVFKREDALPAKHQIWYWKELATLVSAVAAFVAIVPFSQLLLTSSSFMSLVQSVPAAPSRPEGRARVWFWALFWLGALIACFTYIPMARLSQVLFAAASTRQQTWFFPQRMNNAVMLWAVLNGTVGFGVLMVSHVFVARASLPANAKRDWGARITWGELLKTATLALTIFGFFFSILFLVYYFSHSRLSMRFLWREGLPTRHVCAPGDVHPLLLRFLPL